MGKSVFNQCIFVVLLLLFTSLIGCSSSDTVVDDTGNSDASADPIISDIKQVSQEDSQSMVEDYIVKSSLYINNKGRNLQLVETIEMRCPSCWAFVYEFDVETAQMPGRTTGLQITIPINQGDINDDYVEIIQVPLYEPVEPLVGGDRDEHGCIPSAGYTWCEQKQKCLRTWEEPCEKADILELDPQACADNGFVWCDLKAKCIEEWQEECDDPVVVDPDECILIGGRSSEGADIGCSEDEVSAGQIIGEDGTSLCCIKN